MCKYWQWYLQAVKQGWATYSGGGAGDTLVKQPWGQGVPLTLGQDSVHSQLLEKVCSVHCAVPKRPL